MNKKIILVGKAASGKDYFRDFLIKKGYKTSIPHTTRPMREGEVNGETYYFIDERNFLKCIDNDYFFEYKNFNGWLYGTSVAEMEHGNVFIFTPSGIKDLPESFLNDSTVVYFDIDAETRIERLNKRSDSDTIERRLLADEKDFKNFTHWNIIVHDSLFDCEYLLKKIKVYD